jgi:hypothetical protein
VNRKKGKKKKKKKEEEEQNCRVNLVQHVASSQCLQWQYYTTHIEHHY